MSQIAGFDTSWNSESTAKALTLPIGAASPLWALYAGMATAGVGLWWMSQMFRPMNLEAMAGGLSGLAPMMPKSPAIAPLQALAALQLEPVASDPEVEAEAEALEPVRAAVEPVLEVVDSVVALDEVLEMTAPDDLTQLSGIGPTLATKLGELGVSRFEQIAAWTQEDIDQFEKSLRLMGRVAREKWVDQARQLAQA